MLGAAALDQAVTSVLMQLTSAVFIALYIIGMAAAVKLFGSEPSKRRSALIALLVCLAIYVFTGWTGLYPLILAGIGWCLAARRVPQKPGRTEDLKTL